MMYVRWGLSARRGRRRAGGLPAGVLAFLACGASMSFAVTHLKRGDAPPSFSLHDLQGGEFALPRKVAAPLILVFGELYHPGTVKASEVIRSILADRRIQESGVDCRLIVTQRGTPESLREDARKLGVTLPILRDEEKKVFAAYQVSVLPSTLVLNAEGRVVYALAGVPPAFRDIVTDAALFGAGKLKEGDFERTLHPRAAAPTSQPSIQASRLTELARQLAERGMDDLARQKFGEAIAADATYAPALVGLGRCELKSRRLAEAEEHFQAAIRLQADESDAILGLVYVQTLRGGDELKPAEERIRGLLASHPNHSEAHYVLGLICDQTGRCKEASASYRKAAELLLARSGGE